MNIADSIKVRELKKKLRHNHRLSPDEIATVRGLLAGDAMELAMFDIELKVQADGVARRVGESRKNAAARKYDIGEIPEVENPERRQRCEMSAVEFGITYFMDRLLHHAPSELMKEFLGHADVSVIRGALVHVRMPRGSGKTTWMIIIVIWALLYQHRNYLIVIGATLDSAKGLVDNIIWELEGNPLLAADFPEIVMPLKALGGNAVMQKRQSYNGVATRILYSNKKFRLPTVTIDGITYGGGIIEAVGAGGVVRGKNTEGRRPDMVFVDDIQKREDAESDKLVKKLCKYMKSDVLGVFGRNVDKVVLMTSTVVAPRDFSEQMADPSENPGWQTHTIKFIVKASKRNDLIEQYLAIRAEDVALKNVSLSNAIEFYKEHQQEIEKDTVVLDPLAHSPTELSAYHHALNAIGEMGIDAFNAEMQMEVRKESSVYALTPEIVLRRLNGHSAFVVPAVCRAGVVATIDVMNEAGLRWIVTAFGIEREVAVIGYGTWPSNGRRIYEKTDDHEVACSKIAAAVQSLIEDLSLAQFAVQGSKDVVTIDCVGIDCGWSAKMVHQICVRNKRLFTRIEPMKGVSWVNFHPVDAKGRPKGNVTLADEWAFRSRGQYSDFVGFHSDYFAELSQRSWLREPLQPGSVSLFSGETHIVFADEVTADEIVMKDETRRGVKIWKWNVRRANHFGDCLKMAFAMAYWHKIYRPADSIKKTTATRKRAAPPIKFDERKSANAAKKKKRFHRPNVVFG